jgi:hypothetical protein
MNRVQREQPLGFGGDQLDGLAAAGPRLLVGDLDGPVCGDDLLRIPVGHADRGDSVRAAGERVIGWAARA